MRRLLLLLLGRRRPTAALDHFSIVMYGDKNDVASRRQQRRRRRRRPFCSHQRRFSSPSLYAADVGLNICVTQITLSFKTARTTSLLHGMIERRSVMRRPSDVVEASKTLSVQVGSITTKSLLKKQTTPIYLVWMTFSPKF